MYRKRVIPKGLVERLRKKNKIELKRERSLSTGMMWKQRQVHSKGLVKKDGNQCLIKCISMGADGVAHV